MSTIAEFRLPAANTVLASTFESVADLTVELESSVSKSLPNLWMIGPPASTVVPALSADPTIDSFELLATTDDRSLFDVTFDGSCGLIGDELLEQGSLLEARGQNGWWLLKMRFLDREALASAHDRLTQLGTGVDLVRVADVEGTEIRGTLTPEQREALVKALQQGYFEIPRRISMEELAKELDISHQALSERFRRGYQRLVDEELRPIGEEQ